MTSYFILSESDTFSHDADAADPVVENNGGNREHPVFRILKSRRETTHKEKENQITQAVRDLFLQPPRRDVICNNPPRSVQHNRAFILDTSTDRALEEDLLTDDCGIWLNNGQPFFYFKQSGVERSELTRAGR